MQLRGQHGYAMVALIVAMSIMAIMMTVAMPTWRQMAQREKEAELIFRGQQYARAIGLFQKKSGPGVLPPNIDALVDGHYLRKKYKDPITGGDFDVLNAGGPTTTPGAGTANPTAQSGSAGRGGTTSQGAPSQPAGAFGQTASTGRGGVMGVASKSKDTSIRIYNGRTHYNEWQFVYTVQTTAPGQGAGPGGQPQRGGQNQGPNGAGGVGGVGGGRGGDRGNGGGRGNGGPFGGPQGGRGGFPGSGGFPGGGFPPPQTPPTPGRR
jgi:type II secretory pathway pseudopilin PulG